MSAQLPFGKQFLCDAKQLSSGSEQQDVDESPPEFEALLNYLKHSRNCDLTGYKRSSLMRRFKHRMQSINIDTYRSYLHYLQIHPEEYRALLDDVLINVTSFFRDRDAWDHLAAEIIPKMIAEKQPDQPIRVWSAGCAAGQEIYSVLILLAEALGLEACLQQVQCFATDADDSVLNQARQAVYSPLEVADVPAELLQKYFELTEKGYVFCPQLRRTVTFARYDLIQNAPILRIDLLICRNVLIYFNSDVQAAILVRFHFVLRNAGFLFLGKAETLLSRRQIFTPVCSKHRIYSKGTELRLDEYLVLAPKRRVPQPTSSLLPQNEFWEAAFETNTLAHLAIDVTGCLLYANEQARTLFSLTPNDLKRPLLELEPGQLIGSSTLTQALRSPHNLPRLKNIGWTTAEGEKHFEIELSRVLSSGNQLMGIMLTWVQPSAHQESAAELKAARSGLAQVYQALEQAQFQLRAAYDRLESTQKELQVLQQEMAFRHHENL